ARRMELSIDPLVLVLAAATSLLSAVLFGLVPILQQARPKFATAPGGSSRNVSLSRDRHRSQNTLVIVQVALAMVLLVGAGLMIRSFQTLLSVQPGFTHPA